MKIIINNIQYVQICDLNFISNLPNYVIDEMKIRHKYFDFEEFKNKKTIDFINNRKEIIDYNSIRYLSIESLYDLIHKLYEELFRLEIKHKNESWYIKKKLKYEYMVYTLKNYIDYKEFYDKRFEIIENKNKKLVKEN